MLPRTALALLLLLSFPVSAQDLPRAVSAVVRISGTRGGTPVRGSGFVVGFDGDKATIVTASHVIEGVQQLEVAFAADSTDRFPVEADGVLGMDTGSPNGLAVFQVRGAIPAGVTSLSFEAKSRPSLDDELVLVGFPRMELTPRILRRRLSGWSGVLLLIDQGSGEGLSGGPVLQGGKVVGIITAMDDQTTYAVSAVVARVALEGWRVNLDAQGKTASALSPSSTPPKPAAPSLGKCVREEETTKNGIVFVRICPGTFTMGSAEKDADAEEKPAHQVTLSELWIGKTEITKEQYRLFDPKHQGEASLPAAGIRWNEAQAACEQLGGRLPTEAEWEYAARAGSTTAWPFGDDEKKLGDYAWYDNNSGDKIHPVGTKKANAWGLYDMYGNVSEWVADWYAPYSSGPQTDPTGPSEGELRAARGGAFDSQPWFMRSAFRNRNMPATRLRNFGFRCARDSSPQP